MNLSLLLEDALSERGNAVIVIARPADGENAVIQAANAPFAAIMGLDTDRVTGSRLAELRPRIELPEDWAALIAAVTSHSPLTLDMKLRVNSREVWLGFYLTFKVNADDGTRIGILIGRNITEFRERSTRENEMQRLLASVFLRVSAAVVVVGGDGAILMANPASQHLLGYEAAEFVGLNVEKLTPPEFAEAARAARARQLLDGGSYEMRMDTLTKAGVRVPVALTSALLRDARDRRLRVVTLIPDSGARDPATTAARPDRADHAGFGELPPRTEIGQLPVRAGVGQLHAISLAALKTAYGRSWPKLADRAMMMAEHTIKRRLGPADVFSRGDDHSFVIWFEGIDGVRNYAVLTRIVREIRLRFLTEMGADVPENVRPEMIGSEAIPVEPRDHPPSVVSPAALSDLAEEDARPDVRDARTLLRDLRLGTVADVRPVTGRDGRTRPIVMVDFIPSVRRRIYDLEPSLPDEPDRGTGLDLLRLELAIRELAVQPPETSVLVPLSWPSLIESGSRVSLDERLARMRPDARPCLMLAISGVPHLVSLRRWSDTVDPLQRQLGDVGLLLTRRDADLVSMRDGIIGAWPLSLLVIDGTDGPPRVSDVYFSLIAAARKREISVVVRSAAADDIRDWRELGATMFVAPA